MTTPLPDGNQGGPPGDKRYSGRRWKYQFVKSRDSWLDVLVLEHLSIPLTILFARAGVRPNLVSFVSIFLKLLAGVSFGAAGLRMGAAIWLVSFVLDGVDGKLARSTGRTTRFGAKLDYSADFGLFAGLLIVLGRVAGLPVWLVALCVGTGVASALATGSSTMPTVAELGRGKLRGWDGFTASRGLVCWPGVVEVHFSLFFIGPLVGKGAMGVVTAIAAGYFLAAWSGKLARSLREG